MQERYEASAIEARWQQTWQARATFETPNGAARKFYVVEMFPYPSGRIHMGHVRNYSIGDVLARFKRMQGYSVVHPIGFDAFGLPAENAAIERGIHPSRWTLDNIATMRHELSRMGCSYDWAREVVTCRPDYYRWEQELFVRLMERDIAYRQTQFVNWCPDCNTVLANEQVKEGCCERCGFAVETRELPGWYLRITRYADELVDDLVHLEGAWDGRVLAQQREWIGRSPGTEVDFPLETPCAGWTQLKIFTTRPDTLFGVTFMSLAPEHPLALELARGTEREAAVRAFVESARAAALKRHGADDYAKEGVDTGRYCINPVNGDRVRIFIANFVLMEYGTGAIMAVPAHDQRDFEFARTYDIPIKVVIQPPDRTLDPATMDHAYVDEGVQVHSGPFDGIANRDAMGRITDYLVERGQGRRKVHYRLRDWSVARQRYWGCPIPVVYCAACGVVPESLAKLPVVLPEDVEITGKGDSPQARHATFPHATCPRCGGPARRETDTFDTFMESSWYMHRYLCSRYTEGPLDPAALRWGMPVDQYIGGIEHATGHLMYTRFFHRALRDLGYDVGGREPAARLLCQGMVCMPTYSYKDDESGRTAWLYPKEVDKDGRHVGTGREVTVGRSEKMSKSKRNLVDPDDIIARYGADTARLFILSDSPPEADLHWSDAGVEGAHKYLLRLWRFVYDLLPRLRSVTPAAGSDDSLGPEALQLRRLTHQTLARVTQDLDGRFRFNTAIARMRELTDGLRAAGENPLVPAPVLREALDALLHMLCPFVPHVAEELWQALGGTDLLTTRPWPQADAELAKAEKVAVVVQINGKKRASLEVEPDAAEAAILAATHDNPKVAEQLAGKTVLKTVYVPARDGRTALVNIVVR